MGRFKVTAAAFALASLLPSVVAKEIDPIVIKGTKFFHENSGEQFFMKGVAYQEDPAMRTSTGGDVTYIDPLANEADCARDVPLLEELKTNTIRVYAIDPEADHGPCMKLLQDAGIYVIADLGQPAVSINRDDGRWNVELYERYTAVIDELAQFPNTLGFFAGNEVSNQGNNTQASAFVKAAVRDMKAYIKDQGYRPMGVGYATNDDPDIRDNLVDYFACGDESEIVDFWGYNIYSWCGESNVKESGFLDRAEAFKDYPRPVFFAEYGCNEVRPRPFTEVKALYGELSELLSGGIVYMYWEETNEYGLVQREGDEVRKLQDFENLAEQMADVDPKGVKMDDYDAPELKLRKCPETGPDWHVSPSALPPTPNRQLCDCMVGSLGCVVAPGVDTDDYESLFDTVCGMDGEPCKGLTIDAESGQYGAYGMCPPTDKLAFAFNRHFVGQQSIPSACDFGGAATTTDAPSSPPEDCKSLLSQAGVEGTGTVTSSPKSGSGSPKKKSAAGLVTAPRLDFGLLQVGAYAVLATLTGAAMIFM